MRCRHRAARRSLNRSEALGRKWRKRQESNLPRTFAGPSTALKAAAVTGHACSSADDLLARAALMQGGARRARGARSARAHRGVVEAELEQRVDVDHDRLRADALLEILQLAGRLDD